jgi:NitT/TauT family transport system permease protein
MSDAVQSAIPSPQSDRYHGLRQRLTRAAPSIALAILILIVWEFLVGALNIQQFLLPAPSSIWSAFGEHLYELLVSARMVVVEAVGGLVIGTILAVIAGLSATRWNVAGRALIPFAIGFNAVPTLVFAPIMNNWFGSVNPLSKMMIVVTLVYYPIMISVVRGLTTVDPAALDLMQSYGAGEVAIFRKLRVPNMLPYFLNALKLGATLSVIGSVVAGYFGGPRAALGVWILNQVILFKFPPAWAGILVACLIGISFYLVVSVVERLFIPWHTSMRRDNS